MKSRAGACSKKMMLEHVLFSEVIFWISLSKLDNTTKYSFSWSAAILTIKTVPSFRPKLYSDTRQPRDAGNRKAGAGSEYFRSSLFPSPLRHHQFPVAGHSSRVHWRGFSTRASYLLTVRRGNNKAHSWWCQTSKNNHQPPAERVRVQGTRWRDCQYIECICIKYSFLSPPAG